MALFGIFIGTLTSMMGYIDRDTSTLLIGLTIMNGSLNYMLYKYETNKCAFDKNNIEGIPTVSVMIFTTTYLSYNILTGPQSYKFK